FWKLRIEDYRAIYEIKVKEKKVIILFIGHRKTVYDDFSRLI
ncbi:MAG: type II toxin-antitoxin system RelE/ParE family toxin, partial [Methanomicrobia archaeon]|nr:type II toxin-antitoxin system RelE/ParE family toxin [Methanomicrobia archaeon]